MFWTGDGKTNSEENGSKHYANLICS